MEYKKLQEYYSREDVLSALLEAAKGREISATLQQGGHMVRPNTIQYSRDILEMIKKGAVSFHGSVERWKNAMALETGMGPDKLNELRDGWDLLIDIDSALGMEESKLAAKHVIKFLGRYAVVPSIKFSGNRGFHLGVPWECFPKMIDYAPTAAQYPEIPRAVASFIKESIREELMSDLIRQKGSMKALVEELGEAVGEINPFQFVEIENNWGSRHLFRLPYSLNEKSWLVSLPIKDVGSFEKTNADPAKIKVGVKFLQNVDNDATELVLAAMDWHSKQKKAEKITGKRIHSTRMIPEERFPPCIKMMLGGLSDGKKRSLFVLINFLQNMNWPWDKIESSLRDWNGRNKPPLPEAYLVSQIKWAARQERKLLPPNCDNETFKQMGFYEACCKEVDHTNIKNPVVYPFKRIKQR